jgi:tetratricopeptide (TPR) repeat protein
MTVLSRLAARSVRRGAFGRPGLGRARLLALALAAAWAGRPAGADSLQDRLSQARRVCRENPRSVRALDRLAALELREFRNTHAAETLASAGASVERALSIDPADFDARRFRASILLTNHAFADVEREATALAAERPWDVDVLGMAADAQMESGRYPEALATIQRMVDIRPGLPSYSRVAYAREIHGDLAGALAAMDMAIAAGDPADPEGVSWCLARSGLLLWKLGRVTEAASRFDEARRLFPRSPHAWEGLGFVASARGDYGEASADFEKAFSIVPWPQYAVERAGTARALGRPEDVHRWEAIVRAIERLSTEAGLFNRVLALFESDHGDPARGVAMAAAELAVRKDVYGWDAYAWALCRDGRISEAAEAASRALERGTQDPMLDAHAGIIFAAAGQREAARSHLSRALAVNPRFDVVRSADAREVLSRLADSTGSSTGGGR